MRAEPCRSTRRMTRQYAAVKLLEHGPLRFPEFTAITGWPASAAAAVLQHLRSQSFSITTKSSTSASPTDGKTPTTISETVPKPN